MTNIRKCAQAVIDTWDEHGVTACIVHIEALRQALADAPKPEVKPTDKWGAESGWMPFDESTAVNESAPKGVSDEQ